MQIVFYYLCTQSLSVASYGPGKAVSLEFNLSQKSRRQTNKQEVEPITAKRKPRKFFLWNLGFEVNRTRTCDSPQKPEMQISSLASDPQGWLPSSENLAAVAEGVWWEFFPLPRKNVLWLRRSNWIGILDRGIFQMRWHLVATIPRSAIKFVNL